MYASLNDYILSCELLGHTMDVRSVTVTGSTAEDQVIVSGSRDKTVKLWRHNGDDYYETLTLQDHQNFVSCVYYYEPKQWICTGSNDATVCIYKENGYIPILKLLGHESTVCAIGAGCYPQSIITGSWDKTARIWAIDQYGGYSCVVLNGHDAAVWAVASIPKAKKYVTGAADKSIRYWSGHGEKLHVLLGHTDCVRDILVLSDKSLVSCSNDATIRHWNDKGECVNVLSGHTNYIYALAQLTVIGEHVIVSCGEDSALRMWNLLTGEQLGEPIVHPAESIWSVACLRNGDIVTGCNDGVVRVFTKDPARFASSNVQRAFKQAVDAHVATLHKEASGVEQQALPGVEALRTSGTHDGQTRMVRTVDGTVKCYKWNLVEWTLVGDVAGAMPSQATPGKKIMYDGKEYEFVFDVDISDTEPPLKLPYNTGEDPMQAAQEFLSRNDLPKVYLDQVVDFIVKHASAPPTTSTATPVPYTAGAHYKPDAHHFPVDEYLTFDSCDPQKVLEKLKEFNKKLSQSDAKVSETLLQTVMLLAADAPELDEIAIEALQHLLHWPSDILFPVLDVSRLAVRHEKLFGLLNSHDFLDKVLPEISSSVPNQLMIVRCLANMMSHAVGRKQIETRLPALVSHISNIKTGSANLQIAIATFYLNVSVWQTLVVAQREKCRLLTEGIIELLKWANDLEACYRAMQTIGNLTTTPFGEECAAQVISVDYVMDKIAELTKTPQSGDFVKVNGAGEALLASFSS